MREGPPAPQYVIAIHGGAGAVRREWMTQEVEAAVHAALARALRSGGAILEADGPALDAVVAAVQVLEDAPEFNAGHGAVLNREGFCELDAAVMEGANRRAGGVAVVRRIRNPIVAARLVLERTSHVLLAGEGADRFAAEAGLELAEPGYFVTAPRQRQLEELLAGVAGEAGPSHAGVGGAAQMGTVGAVALDRSGCVVAGTSTGGMAGKLPGRVGDSPLLGAGLWADNATCAVSATGMGECIMRALVAYEIASLIAHRHAPLREAAAQAVETSLGRLGGEGGVIAVNCRGNLAMPFNSAAMYRGHLREGGQPVTAIWPDGG